MDLLRERTLTKNLVYSGKVIQVHCDTVELPDGRSSIREVVKHPGAIAVVPILADGRIVFVQQYRYPVQKIMLEIPAGKLDENEKPEDCVIRELQEETGYVAKRIRKLTSIYTAPGFTDEIIHLYVAEELELLEQATDEDEFIHVTYLSREQIKIMAYDGTINDGKSLVALFLAGIMA